MMTPEPTVQGIIKYNTRPTRHSNGPRVSPSDTSMVVGVIVALVRLLCSIVVFLVGDSMCSSLKFNWSVSNPPITHVTKSTLTIPHPYAL